MQGKESDKEVANNTTNEDLIAAKVRDTTAAAKLKEMKLAILKKEYVKLEDVNKRWEEQAARIKAKLLGLPARLTTQLFEKSRLDINIILTGVVNEVLNELAGGYEI